MILVRESALAAEFAFCAQHIFIVITTFSQQRVWPLEAKPFVIIGTVKNNFICFVSVSLVESATVYPIEEYPFKRFSYIFL
ncbi:hypothetical protein GCM10020331_063980 [Ectobacillus funiculus]